jgi:hypothetical protein
MKNLGGYPAEINCRGRIPHPNPVIKFHSKQAGDTETFWTGTYPHLPDGQEANFSHVILLPTGLGTVGDREIILTDVEVSQFQSGRHASRTFDMMVSI